MIAASVPHPDSSVMLQPRPRPLLLLVEPQFMLRRTVVATARELNLADIQEASSYETAAKLLVKTRFDGVLLSFDDSPDGMRLLQQIRAGATACHKDTGMVVITEPCDDAAQEHFKTLDIRRVIARPVKVRNILEAVISLIPRRP